MKTLFAVVLAVAVGVPLPAQSGVVSRAAIGSSLITETDGDLVAISVEGRITMASGSISDALDSDLLDTSTITSRYLTLSGSEIDLVTPKLIYESADSAAIRHEQTAAYLVDALGWVETWAPSVQGYAASGSGGTTTIEETVWRSNPDGSFRTRTITVSGPSWWKPNKLAGDLEKQLNYYYTQGWTVGQPPNA